MAIVTNEAEFRSAISNKEAEIIALNDINLTTRATVGYTVTIRGKPGVSLFWAKPTTAIRDMFYVTGELTIESLILDAENRDGTLVRVSGGTFIMNEGAVLRNLTSTTAQNAVRIGNMQTPSGGTFIMNGGLITGVISGDSAVFCSGGTMVMNNDAEISGNKHSGVTLTDTLQGGVRSTLTMTGNSHISYNECQLKGGYGGAGRILGSDVIMGVQEGDAPVIQGNRSIGNCGGFYFLPGLNDSTLSSLTMRYGAVVSDNYAANLAGGIGAVYANLLISDTAAVINNQCGGNGGGLLLSTKCMAVLDGQAQISGNTAAGKGGGIFISTGGRLDLTGQASIADNTAAEGDGVYKEGVLNLSGAPRISDDLFFDDLQPGVSADFQPVELGRAHISAGDTVEGARVRLVTPESASAPKDSAAVGASQAGNGVGGTPLHSDNVPIIAGALADIASIQLQSSGYISPQKVPLVIADKGPDCPPLCETDRAAWRLPPNFGPGYAVILNTALNQVLISYNSYRITYCDLFDAENPNPDSYNISDLPIVLCDPGERPGYAFAGWQDADGQRVAEIPVGTTGDLTLTAVWKKLFLSFDGNAPCVCNIPKAIPAGPDGKVKIPTIVPCRPCHRFICWNIPASGSGKTYYPGDTISLSGSSITLYAQWQPDCCICHERGKAPGSSTKCIVDWEEQNWLRF